MNQRKNEIMEILHHTEEPISASDLAKHFSVSRQSIVGDIALLRASGASIIATSRGYILSDDGEEQSFPYVGTLACIHSKELLPEELYTIVDLGGTVLDVIVEHAIYGELCGKLDVSSRYEVDEFVKRLDEDTGAVPISTLTGGIHLHHIGCKSKIAFDRIRQRLLEQGIAQE